MTQTVQPNELKYPLSEDDYDFQNRGSIIFTPKIWSSEGSLAAIKQAVLGQISNFTQNGEIDIKKLTSEVQSSVKKYGSSNMQGFKELLTDEVITNSDKGGSKAVKIQLPLRQVQLNLQHAWEDSDVLQASGGDKGIPGGIAANLAASKILQQAESIAGPVKGTAQSLTGEYIIKPQRKTYSGTAPIEISLTYNFSPRSAEEAKMIKKITNIFKFLSVTQSGKEATKDAFAIGKNPAIWQLSFNRRVNNIPKGQENLWNNLLFNNGKTLGDGKYNKNPDKNILPYMVLMNVSGNYGDDDNNFVTFEDGFPNVIQMSMSFQQYFTIQSAQVLFGYDSVRQILDE
jgi:hypothetical protein